MSRHQQYGFHHSTCFAPNQKHLGWTMLYNTNQDRLTNQLEDTEQLRKELRKSELRVGMVDALGQIGVLIWV